jgi:hypothetical protein
VALPIGGYAPHGIWANMEGINSGLLYSSTTQVLLNGTPGKRIFHRHGLRQYDPLSLMPFILVIDMLGHMFSKAAEEEILQPLARWVLPHIVYLYADDVAIFI